MFGVTLCSIGLLLVVLIHTAVTKEHLVMGGVGHTVILPCVSPLEASCSDIRWFHSDQSNTNIVARIPRREAANTSRLNISSDCSLHINNITEVDVGRYWCSKHAEDTEYLSLITVSSQPRSNLFPGANVTLSCGLVTYEGPGRCFSPLYEGMSLKWQDDTRPDHVLAVRWISRCSVWLNVTIQRGSRFSCLALVNHQVQSRVEFPVSIRVGDGADNSQVIGRVIAVAVVGCAMMVVLGLILVKKMKRKPNDQLVARPETPLHVNTVINTDGATTAEDVS